MNLWCPNSDCAKNGNTKYEQVLWEISMVWPFGGFMLAYCKAVFWLFQEFSGV